MLLVTRRLQGSVLVRRLLIRMGLAGAMLLVTTGRLVTASSAGRRRIVPNKFMVRRFLSAELLVPKENERARLGAFFPPLLCDMFVVSSLPTLKAVDVGSDCDRRSESAIGELFSIGFQRRLSFRQVMFDVFSTWHDSFSVVDACSPLVTLLLRTIVEQEE